MLMDTDLTSWYFYRTLGVALIVCKVEKKWNVKVVKKLIYGVSTIIIGVLEELRWIILL